MASGPVYRADLYRGTAPYYERFRPPYPDALFGDLRQRVPISGAGRLLDVACGTGQIAFALAGDFAAVWAVDQESAFVAFGRAKAERLGVTNIEWLAGRAEEVTIEGPFELVAVGNAFHRLDRRRIAHRARSWLAPEGCLALLWGGTPWLGESGWQRAMACALDEWTGTAGAVGRVPVGWDEAIRRDPNERVLERAGLSFVGRSEYCVEHSWSLESLTGFVYSTSFLNRQALGTHVEAFEEDLQHRLLACEPAGVFRQTLSFGLDLARRPG